MKYYMMLFNINEMNAIADEGAFLGLIMIALTYIWIYKWLYEFYIGGLFLACIYYYFASYYTNHEFLYCPIGFSLIMPEAAIG